MLASTAMEAATTSAVFRAFLDRALLPGLRRTKPGAVLVLDNLGAHKTPEVRKLLDRSGFACRFLPPYPPGANPIEAALAKVKAALRRVGARRAETLHQALGPALDSIADGDASGFFRRAGYSLPSNRRFALAVRAAVTGSRRQRVAAVAGGVRKAQSRSSAASQRKHGFENRANIDRTVTSTAACSRTSVNVMLPRKRAPAARRGQHHAATAEKTPETPKAPTAVIRSAPSTSGSGKRVRGQDLNLRPSGYEPDELPGCSTPRRGGRAPSRRRVGRRREGGRSGTGCVRSWCARARMARAGGQKGGGRPPGWRAPAGAARHGGTVWRCARRRPGGWFPRAVARGGARP